MFNPKKLEEIAKQVGDVIPKGVKNIGEEVERKVKQILQAQLSKLNMVSREEFDVQTNVLLRTREKITTLQIQVSEIEQQLKKLDGNKE
ncbi:MAG: accessory factor UbiK family protein [Psychromonas sp.]|nr:accessory factor UbiK family protein [Psychromonas sp.]